ncbi:MAG TPA: hypothetical protein VHP11_17135 [Tepidisphaeraceae bacterium]|nr:hypothetical protein [Tepidisphaeraceae bacterium]
MVLQRMLKGIGFGALGALFVLAGQPQTASADAVGWTWATNAVVPEGHRGNRADPNAGPVAANRSNLNNALGSPDAPAIGGTNFYSIGMGGEVIFTFGTEFTNDSAVIYEITNGNRRDYPETAMLSVATLDDPTHFYDVGEIRNDGVAGELITIDLGSLSAPSPFYYLKLTDTTNRNFFWNGQSGRDRNADGFDINAVGVVAVNAVPLPAAGWAGLSLLGGLGVAKWRRTRNA